MGGTVMEGQQFVLTDYADGQRRITPVTGETVTAQLEKLLPGQQFRIEPELPVPAEDGLELIAVNCVRAPESSGLMLVAMLREPGGEAPTAGYIQTLSSQKWAERNQGAPLTSAERARQVLLALVETGEAPDFGRGWQPVQLSAATPEQTRRMKAKEGQGKMLGDNKGKKK